LDMDVTPMDNSNTKKEGVSFTYKKFMGYAPMMAYIGKEGYLVNTELREGKQHCQSGTPEFLRQTMNLCRKITDKPVLVRLDSGNDAAENVGIMLENGAYYVIKRNLRKEDRNEWAENIRSWCKDIREPREGKKVYVGSTFKDLFYATEDGEQKSICNRIVYEMIERDSSPDGQFFLEPEIELNMFWTNLGESDQEIIDLYHAHGECEQFHSEIKTDMGVERLPSGKFDTNELVLELTMIAYNILRMLGQETVHQGKAPSKRIVARKRIRTVIQNIIHFAGQLTKHARQLFSFYQQKQCLGEYLFGAGAPLCCLLSFTDSGYTKEYSQDLIKPLSKEDNKLQESDKYFDYWDRLSDGIINIEDIDNQKIRFIITKQKYYALDNVFRMRAGLENYNYYLIDIIDEHNSCLIMSNPDDPENIGKSIRYDASEHSADSEIFSGKKVKEDEPLYEIYYDDTNGKSYYSGYVPIIDNGEIKCYLCIQYDWSKFRSELISRSIKTIIIGFIVLVALNALLMLFIYLKAISPIQKVTSGVMEYKENNDLSVVSEKMNRIKVRNEIGVLADSFAEFAEEIDRHTNEILKLNSEK